MKIVFGGAANQIDQSRLAEWQAEFPAVEFIVTTTPDEMVAAAPGSDAWVGRITRDAFLAARPHLRWIHSTGAGIEKLSAIQELVESDVILTNTRGAHGSTIAEHVFAMLLALTRCMPDLYRQQQQHIYKNPGTKSGLREISGATMVIVGFGSIGRTIAKRAVGFEMRVIGVDLYPSPPPAGVAAVVHLDQLEAVLPQADVIVVTVPFTRQTRGLFDARRISLIKPGGYLFAVSRGGVVDDDAVVEALRAGHLAGAGLDVQAVEPVPADSPIWDAPNLILSPHCSGTSQQTTERVWAITVDNIRRFVAGMPLQNVCDKDAGF